MPIIKTPIVFERKVSKRSEEETLERRTFPDPGKNKQKKQFLAKKELKSNNFQLKVFF